MLSDKVNSIVSRLNYWGRRLHPETITVRTQAWLKNKFNVKNYRSLSVNQLKNQRSSKKVFIFGSGYSINEITDRQWKHIEQNDTVSFNWFIRQDFIPIDFHLIREISPDDFDPGIWKKELDEYQEVLRNSPYYENATFLIQGGFSAINGNRMIGLNLLPEGSDIFRYTNKRGHYGPSENFEEGLVHSSGTLSDVVNFAYLMGWNEIILCGVDLYDTRYFWLDYDETRDRHKNEGHSHDEAHKTSGGIIDLMDQWGTYLKDRGVTLSVENPDSLLSDIIPVYSYPD